MNNTMGHILTFSLGMAVGAIAASRIFKAKYEQITQEEIASIKEAFSSRTEPVEERPEQSPNVGETDLEKAASIYNNIINKENYTNYSDVEQKKEGVLNVGEDLTHYVIAPEEFGEHDDYETESLVYYADEVLADNFDGIIEDVDSMVGQDFAEHFGEYEDDSVFIRNDALKTDYEILRDTRRYRDVVGGSSNQTED